MILVGEIKSFEIDGVASKMINNDIIVRIE